MAFHTLIVEDDKSFKRIVEIRLKSWKPDIQIVSADTLAAARTLLDTFEQPLTLIILDQHLPDGRGWELLDHPRVTEAAVLAVSSDDSADLPGQTLRAGAQHFLGKRQVTEPLFLPLLEGMLERKALQDELLQAKIRQSKMDSIKTLIGTLKHEINNPLGAVLGGAYLIETSGSLDANQEEAVRLVKQSGERIKHVLNQLCEAAELEEVQKSHAKVFHVPGDKPWGASSKKKPEQDS